MPPLKFFSAAGSERDSEQPQRDKTTTKRQKEKHTKRHKTITKTQNNPADGFVSGVVYQLVQDEPPSEYLDLFDFFVTTSEVPWFPVILF